jgi:hypothetical protein
MHFDIALRRMKMTRILSITFALMLGAAVIAVSKTHASVAIHATDQQVTNGAFRDGVYLGRLDAANGTPAHVAAGRWAHPTDRKAFSTGYQQGYAAASHDKNVGSPIAAAS